MWTIWPVIYVSDVFTCRFILVLAGIYQWVPLLAESGGRGTLQCQLHFSHLKISLTTHVLQIKDTIYNLREKEEIRGKKE